MWFWSRRKIRKRKRRIFKKIPFKIPLPPSPRTPYTSIHRYPNPLTADNDADTESGSRESAGFAKGLRTGNEEQVYVDNANSGTVGRMVSVLDVIDAFIESGCGFWIGMDGANLGCEVSFDAFVASIFCILELSPTDQFSVPRICTQLYPPRSHPKSRCMVVFFHRNV